MQSTPQATVPPEFKNRIIGMIQGIQQVDNRYLTKNAEFMQNMLAPTIRGGIGQFKTPIQDMTNTITETGGGKTGEQAYSDPAKEARYQAWKKESRIMNENEEFEFRARAEQEAQNQPQQKMGGKPPLGFVASKMMNLALWNKVSLECFRRSQEWGQRNLWHGS